MSSKGSTILDIEMNRLCSQKLRFENFNVQILMRIKTQTSKKKMNVNILSKHFYPPEFSIRI